MSETGVQGSYIWHEIHTGDPGQAKGFYTELVGWQTRDMDMGGGETYTMFTHNGDDHGGMVRLQGGGSPHWLVYIGVDDVDATCAKARKLGGKVTLDPMEIPVGRFAILQDPAGATFAVFTPKG